MVILQSLNLVIRFLLELCGLGALGYWGFRTGNGIAMKIALATATPILFAVVWGIFGSPKSIVKLSVILHIFLELIVFGLPAIALFSAGKHQLAWIYGICVVVNRIFMVIWKQ